MPREFLGTPSGNPEGFLRESLGIPWGIPRGIPRECLGNGKGGSHRQVSYAKIMRLSPLANYLTAKRLSPPSWAKSGSHRRTAMANGSGCHRQGWGGVGWMAVVTALLMDFAVHLRCRVKQNAICTKLRRHPPQNILDGAVGNYADLFAFFGKSFESAEITGLSDCM